MGSHFPEILTIPLKDRALVTGSSSFPDEEAETNLDDLPFITPFVTVVNGVRSRLSHSEVYEDRFFPQNVPFRTMVLVLYITLAPATPNISLEKKKVHHDEVEVIFIRESEVPEPIISI